MRIAIPSVTSRLHEGVLTVLLDAFGDMDLEFTRRTLTRSVAPGVDLLLCRGTDVPRLVSLGVADVGITGYDMAVEWSLALGTELDIRSLAPARTSFVTYATVQGREVHRIYTEYPHLTKAWAAGSTEHAHCETVVLHGSSEGVIRVDEQSAGVLLVTSGRTSADSGLDLTIPLLETDAVAVRRPGHAVPLGKTELETRPVLPLPSFVTG
ncbi:hypothetical protein [Streptomyces sp. NPDC017940]|uniref:hypothetical protein n=1 Tax=Streptomyces sp. NPDC017940 TaxID=3365017 RepID=UPI0037B5B26A